MSVGLDGGINQVGGCGVESTVGDVLSNRPVEQEGVLQNDPDSASQSVQGHVVEGVPIDGNLTLVGIVESANEVNDGCLARSAWAHQTNQLTGLGKKTDAVQNGWTVVVGEFDGRELDSSIECGGRGFDDGVVDAGQTLDGPVEPPQIVLEGEEGADAETPPRMTCDPP